jgi:hypothetical protein
VRQRRSANLHRIGAVSGIDNLHESNLFSASMERGFPDVRQISPVGRH